MTADNPGQQQENFSSQLAVLVLKLSNWNQLMHLPRRVREHSQSTRDQDVALKAQIYSLKKNKLKQFHELQREFNPAYSLQPTFTKCFSFKALYRREASLLAVTPELPPFWFGFFPIWFFPLCVFPSCAFLSFTLVSVLCIPCCIPRQLFIEGLIHPKTTSPAVCQYSSGCLSPRNSITFLLVGCSSAFTTAHPLCSSRAWSP